MSAGVPEALPLEPTDTEEELFALSSRMMDQAAGMDLRSLYAAALKIVVTTGIFLKLHRSQLHHTLDLMADGHYDGEDALQWREGGA